MRESMCSPGLNGGPRRFHAVCAQTQAHSHSGAHATSASAALAAAKRAFDAMMTMRKIDIATIEAARRG